MRNNKSIQALLLLLLITTSIHSQGQTETGDIAINISPGPEWMHDFAPLIKNPPQIAIWITDQNNKYIKTVYVTKKTATEGWMFNNNNRRKEALPYWSHSRGIKYKDGLYLPTKEKPLTDSITGATPKSNFTAYANSANLPQKFFIYIEINHSMDFNDNFPKTSKNQTNGQPSIIYRASVDLQSGENKYVFEALGYSEPDGTSGKIYTDINKLTTALNIIEKANVEIIKDEL